MREFSLPETEAGGIQASFLASLRRALATPRSAWLALILCTSVMLDLAGNSWGAPDRWHPDELDARAAAMLAQKTLNPQFFPYGGWHYYVLELTAAAPVGLYQALFDRKPAASQAEALGAWRDRKNARVQLMGRAVSAVLATLLVFVTYRMGALLFSAQTGLIGAALLALAPYLTMIAHFATADVAADFWYWLACLFGLLAWKRAERPWLAIAALAAGLAIGIKVDRAVVVLPVFLAPFLRGPGRTLSLPALAARVLLVPLGYVLANPTLLLSFFEFVNGTARDLIFNSLRGEGAGSFVSMLVDMRMGLGAPLAFATALALGFVLYEVAVGERRREILWLLSAIVPLYLIFGSRLAQPWYSPFFYPALCLIAAYGFSRLRQALSGALRVAVSAAAAAIAAWSLLQCIAVDQQFRDDARYGAARWIEAHVPAGASIEVGRRGPPLPADRYRIERRAEIPAAYYADDLQTRQALQQDALYRNVQEHLLALHGLVMRLTGRPETPASYRAWFDRVAAPHAAPDESSPAAQSAPDYRVYVDYLDFSLIDAAQKPDSGYRLVARIHYDPPHWRDVPFAFVNPAVYIFQRRG